MATVNKGELAKLLRCSIPHVDALMERYAEFPVVSRGDKGQAWEFDAAEVGEFLAARRAEEEAEAEERSAALNTLQLPGFGKSTAAGSSAHQDLAAVRAERERMKLAQEAGFLVSTSDLRMKLGDMMGRLQTGLRGIPSELRRRHGLPEDVERSCRTMMDEQLDKLVTDLQRDLLAAPEPEVSYG